MNIQDIIEINKEAGFHWFDKSSVAYFGTIIESHPFEIDGIWYFITSEQDPNGYAWDGERRYTIRYMTDNGNIRTWGEFGAYDSLHKATCATDILEGH